MAWNDAAERTGLLYRFVDRLVEWRRPLLGVAVAFALLHFVHLRSDFPLHGQFAWEDAPMVDEGWYSSAAINTFLGRGWVLPGDFNPGVALPVWPAMAWVAFHIGGMGILSLRVLELLVFLMVVWLSYRLAVAYEGEGTGLFAVFFLMTSPFCFVFSRLGFLEFPMLMFLMAAMLTISRPDRQTAMRYGIAGVLTALSLLTKTLVVFLLPGLVYLVIERSNFRASVAAKNLARLAAGTLAVLLAYYLLYARREWVAFAYLFQANIAGGHTMSVLEKVLALSRPLRKGYSTDALFFWTAVASSVGALAIPRLRDLWRRPLFVLSELLIYGYMLMMALHNNSVPRYYAPLLPGLFFVGAILLKKLDVTWPAVARAFVLLIMAEAVVNMGETLYFVARPTYTLLHAAEGVKRVVSADPGPIISHNAFEITLFTGLPAINEDYGAKPIRWRVAHYKPRWWVRQGYWIDGTEMAQQIGDQYRFEPAAEFQVFNHVPGYVVYHLVPITGTKGSAAAGR